MTRSRGGLRKLAAYTFVPLCGLATIFCSSHDEIPEDGITRRLDAVVQAAEPLDLPDVPIVKGTTAGYLPGRSAVTPTGEFTYRIDLDVLPGRAGMEPTISLSYSSRTGSGLLGVGWELDGLSEIRPCGKTFSPDGTSDGIDFNGDDNLCLDGRKLVPLGSSQGVTEYRTEQDSFARILAYDSGGQPTSFVVYRKDGRILEYAPVHAKREDRRDIADIADAQPVVTDVTLAWPISTERDRAGNEMRYEYDVMLDDRPPHAIEYHLSAIAYTFQHDGSGPAGRKVVFSYETRPDASFAYVSGVRLAMTKRLSAVEMHGPNPVAPERLWRYALSYSISATRRSLLTRVEKCGMLGGCLLAKQFQYASPHEPFFEKVFETAEASAGPVHLVFDADGDGKDELLYEGEKGKIYLRSTPPIGPEAESAFEEAPLSLRHEVTAGGSFAQVSLKDSRPVDIDADGTVELAALIPHKEVRFLRWNSKARDFQSFWTPIPISRESARLFWPEPAFFTDLDGNALPDMVKIADMASELGTAWHYWLNQGDAFGKPVLIPYAMHRSGCSQQARQYSSMGVDLGGDGRQALIFVHSGADFCSTVQAVRLDDAGLLLDPAIPIRAALKHVFADLNGDGLRDWVGIQVDGTLQVSWNTGLGFRRNDRPLWPLPNDEDTRGPWHVADFDGDGAEDLWVMRKRPSPALVIFRYLPDQILDGSIAVGMTKTVFKGIASGYLGDFNGDGFLDIAGRTGAGSFQVHAQIAGVPDLLESISDDDTDPRETIRYVLSRSLSQQPLASCRYPQRCIRQGISVVREHVRFGVGRRIYAYEDPRADLRGRGFLGFGKVRIWDPSRGAETTTTYDHDTRIHEAYPYALLPKEVLEAAPILEQDAPSHPMPHRRTARTRFKKRVNVYRTQWLHQRHSYFVHPETWTSWEWEDTADIDWDPEAPMHIPVSADVPAHILRKRTGSFRFDDYGNIIEEKRMTDGGVQRTAVSKYEIRENDWLVGLLQRREDTSSSPPPPPARPGLLPGRGGRPPVRTRDPPPRIVEYGYDDRGLLTEVRIEPDHPDPDIGETVTFTRSPRDGLVSAVVRAAAGQAPRTVSVDSGDGERVFPRRTWNDLGHTFRFAFHPGYGTLGRVEDANGVQTQRIYDDLGRLRSILPDGGANVTIDYKPTLGGSGPQVNGHQVTMRDETGAESFVRYDRWDRPIVDAHRGFDGEWIQRYTAYDWLGQVAVETRPTPGIPIDRTPRTTYRYDSLGRLLEVRLPDGARIRRKHTFFVTRTWDAENHESYVLRDLDDRIVHSVQMLGGAKVPVTYRYRELDLVGTITDAKGNAVELDYDQRGRRTRLRDPSTGTTSYAYNGFGELREKVDALNQVTRYHRDVLGRVVRITDADGETELEWDASDHGIGELSATLSPDGTRRQYHYDALGRPRQLDWTVGGESFSVEMAHDAFGRLSTLAYPEVPGQPRLRVGLTYNAAGYLADITDVSTAVEQLLWRVDGRNLDDALTRGIYGNGLTTERSYDEATGRLKEIQAGSIYALAYAYDANGLVKSRADSVKARSEAFQYDALARLRFWRLQTAGGMRDTEYDFDVLGNLTRVAVDGETTEENQYGGPGAGPHALAASSLYGSFAYDARGRRTDGRGRQIDYTAIDLPRAVTTSSGVTRFGYDAAGMRVKKQGPSGTTISIGDFYERRTDPQGRRSHVFYIQGSEGVVAQMVYDERAQAWHTQYLVTDALGSMAVVTDEAGREIDRRYFAPFGRPIDEHGAPLPGIDTGVRLGFTAHRHDGDLGLIDMRGRMYDPVTRGFLTPDPFVTPSLSSQSHNRHSYALNSPLSLVDPTGFDPWWGSPAPDFRGGYVPGRFQGHFAISSDTGGFSGFFKAIGRSLGAIGRTLQRVFGAGPGREEPSVRRAPRPSPSYADTESRELPSSSSGSASAGPRGGLVEQPGSEQARALLEAQRRAAELEALDRSADVVGAATGLVGAALVLGGPLTAPAGAALIAMSAGIGAFQLQRGLDTGDPLRIAGGALASIPFMMGGISGGGMGAGLRGATAGSRPPATFISGPGGSLIKTGLSPAELLMPGGIRIGQAGASAQIRIIRGGATEARMMFEQLTVGGTPYARYAGTAVTLPGGGFVGIRSVATASGGRSVPAMTIDVRIPGVAIRELKFIP